MNDPRTVLRMAQEEEARAEALQRLARDYINSQQKARRERFRADGCCADCGKPSEKYNCTDCRRKRYNRRRLRRSA